MLMNYVVLLTYLLYLMLSETNDCSKLMNTKNLLWQELKMLHC